MAKGFFSVVGLAISAFFLAFCSVVNAQLSDVTQPGDPIVATSNNSPGSEGVANAIDDQPTKYLNFDELNTGFTITPRIGLSIVQCVTLTSANDAVERDPSSFLLEGSYDGMTFTLIASNSVPEFPTRFFKNVIRFENNTPYLIYRLIFPTVVNAASANSMQISEVELLGFLAPTDVTQPGDPVVATSNNSPGSEGVANAIDDQPTKYLNFDIVNTGFTVTPSVGATLVSGLTLTSANDAPDRDPTTYRLEGSFDGSSFFEIASGSVPAFPTRFFKNYIFFPNSRAYQAYRLIFPTVNNSTCCMQISEVEFLGVVSDPAQDVTQPGDPIVASSNNSPGSEGVANAIDDQPTKYLNFDRLNTGFTVSPGAGLTIVSGLALTSANDAPERDPASFTLEGSYDGTNFTQIATNNVPAFADRFQKVAILLDNKVPYLHYRLIFPTVVGPGGNSMQISEVELLGVLAPTDVTVPGDPIVATSNNSPGSEGVANAIDDQPTKYLNFDIVNTGFTVTPGVGDTIVSGLTLTSANDAPDRDPTSYRLEGSNDGSNFVPVSDGSVPAFPTRFFKNYIFFPDNTKSFKSYRLIFPTVNNSTCCMQISEVEFLGVTPGVVNTNPVDTLIRRQPQDTPVLLGAKATFRVLLTGPWKVQWFRNGVKIAGATSSTYTTPEVTATDGGARYQALVQSPQGVQTSNEVVLSIFTPSATESIGLSWIGSGANGAPTEMFPDDIAGFQRQAYWNNVSGGSGDLLESTNSNNAIHSTITVQWTTSGQWGVGTGEDDPTQRMLNGMTTSFGTSADEAQTVIISGVPQGRHSLLLYTVQVPLEFFNMDFAVVTHDAAAKEVIQRRFIRPQNADEYNPSPGFILVTSDSAATRSVGNMMRFDNLDPRDGIIEIRFFSPGRVQPPGAQPIRGPGLNAFQLLLNQTDVPSPPQITQQPVSANGLIGGQVTLSVVATGPSLSYQWLKNGQPIQGATSSQLMLSNLSTNDAGNYSVAIINPSGRTLSRTAVVGVLQTSLVTEGLVTYFKFDETSGTTVANAAPGGSQGQFVGMGPIASGAGRIGGALVFNGSEDYVFVPDYPKPSEAMTVSGWVFSDSTEWGPIINNWILGRPIGSGGQFFVEIANDLTTGVPALRGQIAVGPNQPVSSGFIDAAGVSAWHHFAMSANGATLSVYWDGAFLSTIDYLGKINTPPFPWLSIGARLTTPAGETNLVVDGIPWQGRIDDLAIWKRSLSDTEIRAIHQAGLSGRAVDTVMLDVPPRFTGIRVNANETITVTWTGGGTLQAAPTVTGPWADVTDAVSPFTFTPTAQMQFARIRR